MKKLREKLLGWKEQLLPKHPMAEAVNYTLSQWAELNVFCSDGAVPIDNNVSEREMKRVVLNRKNSLFVWQRTGWANGGDPSQLNQHLPPARSGSSVVSHAAVDEPTRDKGRRAVRLVARSVEDPPPGSNRELQQRFRTQLTCSSHIAHPI
jgi:Transposase IS66 family